MTGKKMPVAYPSIGIGSPKKPPSLNDLRHVHTILLIPMLSIVLLNT